MLQQSLAFWCRAAVLRTPRCARPHAHQNAPERPPKRASGLQHLSGINVVTHPSNTSLRINVVTQNSNSPFLHNRLGNYPTSASRCTLGQAPPARKPNCSWLGSVPHTGLVALPRHPLLAHISTRSPPASCRLSPTAPHHVAPSAHPHSVGYLQTVMQNPNWFPLPACPSRGRGRHLVALPTVARPPLAHTLARPPWPTR